MKIRCDLHVNGGDRKLILVAKDTETAEHLALKLSGALLFWEDEPKVELSAKHPLLQGSPFVPDLVAWDASGDVRLWVECGRVSMHKLGKLIKRFPASRLVVLKADPREAERLRRDLEEETERASNVEIWAWRAEDFKAWLGALREKTVVVGETHGRTLNLTVNETPLWAELEKV